MVTEQVLLLTALFVGMVTVVIGAAAVVVLTETRNVCGETKDRPVHTLETLSTNIRLPGLYSTAKLLTQITIVGIVAFGFLLCLLLVFHLMLLVDSSLI